MKITEPSKIINSKTISAADQDSLDAKVFAYFKDNNICREDIVHLSTACGTGVGTAFTYFIIYVS